MKELKKVLEIEVPQGYEIDKENSTFEKIVFKKVEEKLTYEKIAEKLFKFNEHYYTNEDGRIMKSSIGWLCPNVAPTEHQLQRLLAINKLMNVAYYLNDGRKSDLNDWKQEKCFIYYDIKTKKIDFGVCRGVINGVICFNSRELAKQAIEILGEEQVKLALGVIKKQNIMEFEIYRTLKGILRKSLAIVLI